jgi:hypothetical protein
VISQQTCNTATCVDIKQSTLVAVTAKSKMLIQKGIYASFVSKIVVKIRSVFRFKIRLNFILFSFHMLPMFLLNMVFSAMGVISDTLQVKLDH